MTPNYDGFTLKHRVFLVKNYYQYTGDYLCVKTKYDDNYKNSDSSPQFSYDALMEIINLFERTGSVFKNLDLEPSSQHIEHVYVKEDPDNRGKPVEIDPMAWDDGNDSFDSLDDVAADRTKVAKHSCDTCGMDFRGSDELTKHMKTHKKEAKFQCSYKSCKKSFNLWKDFNKHRESHKIEKHARTSFCCSCGDSFDKTSEQDTQCPNCSRRKFNDDDEDDGQMDDGVADDEDVPIAQRQSQDKVLHLLNGIHVKLDKLLRGNVSIKNKTGAVSAAKSHVNSTARSTPISTPTSTITSGILQEFTLPLTSVEGVSTLNYRLSDKIYAEEFSLKMKQFTGESGREKGLDIANKLRKRLFTNDVLAEYSWTGLSRSGRPKQEFRNLNYLLATFFEIVKAADNSFTTGQLTTYFRDKILKNANKMINSKDSDFLDIICSNISI